jgi:hypothetical protein
MNDKEMLLLAAKAYGIENGIWWESVGNHPFPDAQCVVYYADGDSRPKCFNPLYDDELLLRLAVKLKIDIFFFDKKVYTFVIDELGHCICEPLNDDQVLSTRRVVVRAAAEMGKNNEQIKRRNKRIQTRDRTCIIHSIEHV